SSIRKALVTKGYSRPKVTTHKRDREQNSHLIIPLRS
ncbi:unnamed protein product, partial [marine sediment metagenome]